MSKKEVTLENQGDPEQTEVKIKKEEQPESETVEDTVKVQSQSRHSERIRKPSIRYGYNEYEDTTNESCYHVAYNVTEVEEPVTQQDAMQTLHAKEWKTAADSEYNSFMENKTWKLVDLPPDRKAVGCKWVFKVKHDI